MANNIKRQVILHNTQGNHNKYYELTVKQQLITKGEHEGEPISPACYFVQARWGRIENFKDGNPQSQVKVDHVSFETAIDWLGDLMYEKQKKGYKVVQDTASGHKAVESTTKKPLKVVKTDPFERTEHVEVVVSDWWTNDNIEERAV